MMLLAKQEDMSVKTALKSAFCVDLGILLCYD